METRKIISLNESDLIRIAQIVIDRDNEDALNFIEEIKQRIDRESASQMKRDKI